MGPELQRHVGVDRIVLGELSCDLKHPLAVERHPRGAVGLLERATARQRRGAIEDADVVQPQETALEEVAVVRVLAIDPPGEVRHQPAEHSCQELAVALAPDLSLALIHIQRSPGGHRRVDVTKVPLVRRDLAVRVHIPSTEQELHLFFGEVDVNLAPYEELAENHSPSELDVPLRALAVVGVRNSELETLHLADHIKQWDWRVLTQGAAYALSDFDALPPGDCEIAEDPFAGIIEAYPTAAAAFAVLTSMRPGDVCEWAASTRPLPPVPTDAVAVPVTPEGYDVQHAMDPRLSRRMVELLQANRDSPYLYAVPSLKHISRNPHKLFRVVDFLLAHATPVATANVYIEPGLITRRCELTRPTGPGAVLRKRRRHGRPGVTTLAHASRAASTSTAVGVSRPRSSAPASENAPSVRCSASAS
jgi:hypothetical protein